MPEPRSIGPVNAIAFARSGVTMPTPTRRCFQMRLSVSSVSYSSTYFGKRLLKSSMKSSSEPWRLSFRSFSAFAFFALRRDVLRHRVRQVAIDAARPVVGRVHARARDGLVHVHQVFAFAERVQEHRHRADVERVRAEPQQVVHQPRDLVEHHADVLRAQRHLDVEQLLDREHVAVLVAHHRHVVEPVHVRHRLEIGPGLGELLGRAMQQPDVRIGALHDLAVELEHEAQHAVGRRMLRTEVQRVVLDLCHGYLRNSAVSLLSRITRGMISRGSIVTGW